MVTKAGLPTIANQAHWFTVWQCLGGDTRLTARALGVEARVVEAMAHDFQWHALSEGPIELNGGEIERKVNRVASYSQGKRLIRLMERAIDLIEQDDTRFKKSLMTEDEFGNSKLNTKPLVELAKALETAHAICYRALGDSIADGKDAEVGGTEEHKALSLEVVRAVHAAACTIGASSVIVEAVKEASP